MIILRSSTPAGTTAWKIQSPKIKPIMAAGTGATARENRGKITCTTIPSTTRIESTGPRMEISNPRNWPRAGSV